VTVSAMPDFGLSELLLPALVSGGLESTAGVAGAAAGSADIAAGVGAGALEGAGFGAATSPIMGGDPGQGALFGALGGGAVGGAGAAGLGIGGQIGAGAASGAVSSGAQGGDPLTGAFTGAAQGAGAGLFSGGSGAGASATGAAGGATGTGMPVDLTAGFSGTGASGDTPFGSSPAFSGTGTGTGVASGTGTGAMALDQYGVPDYSSTPWAGSAGNGGAPNYTGPASDSTFLDRLFSGSSSGNFGNNMSASGEAVTDSGGSSFWKKITDNPQVLLAAAPLLMNMMSGSATDATQAALTRQAAETQSQAKTQMAYQQSGTLPAGLQDALRGATNAAKAQVRSKYAQMGLAGSTMESQAIGQIDQASASQTAQIAMQLFQQGVGLDQISSQIYGRLLTSEMQQDTNLQNAVSSFARGMSGGTSSGNKYSLVQD
jgi:hypothetical protein